MFLITIFMVRMLAVAGEEKFGGGWKFCPQGYMHYDTNIFELR